MTRGEEILSALEIDLWVDGPTIEEVRELIAKPYVRGFTTNPSLLRKIGVTDYEAFGRRFLEASNSLPVSFEVVANDCPEMKRQALKLASWGANVLVKIPITDCAGEYCTDLVRELVAEGVKVNVTAVTTIGQVMAIRRVNPYVISIFAGRLADSGMDPTPIVHECQLAGAAFGAKTLWASTREVYDIFRAQESGCHIITLPVPILGKAIEKVGASMKTESLELVNKFTRDAAEAGLTL